MSAVPKRAALVGILCFGLVGCVSKASSPDPEASSGEVSGESSSGISATRTSTSTTMAGSDESSTGLEVFACGEATRPVCDGDFIQDVGALSALNGCERYTSSIELGRHEGADDLRPISSLREIDGTLSVRRGTAEDLRGFECLERVLALTAWTGPEFKAFTGLDRLQEVTADLFVHNSPSLVDFRGLESLRSVSLLEVSACDNFVSLEGLESLDTVGREIRLAYGEQFADISALAALRDFDGRLELRELGELTSLDGLHNIEELERLIIVDNPVLASLDGLENLQRVSGDLTITGNWILESEEVQALVDRIEVGGELTVQ